MKYFKILIFAFISIGMFACYPAQLLANQNKETSSNEINWMSIEEVQLRMKSNPKRIIIDIYTDWCKWCKVMDREIYKNNDVIQYLNQNFYLVKLNAESKNDIVFNDKIFSFKKDLGMHEFAAELMMGGRSFPTTVIVESNFLNVSPIAGYLELNEFEKIIRYFHEGFGDGLTFESWEQKFVPNWKKNSKK